MSKQDFKCSKCKKNVDELFILSDYAGYKGEFKEIEWLCDACFRAKLDKVNRRRKRENKPIFRNREVRGE